MFKDIVDILHPGDVLVVNTSKVIPARLYGSLRTGGTVEVLLLEEKEPLLWKCMVKPGRKCKHGVSIEFGGDFEGYIMNVDSEGNRIIKFQSSQDFWTALEKYGNTPLPPYIKRKSIKSDISSYQTVYAKEKGSCAAPTAGLHFTEEILQKIKDKGIEILNVVLHVGPGTFQPVKTENILDHKMHSELCQITDFTGKILNQCLRENRRIIAVGTTSARTLESFYVAGSICPGKKWTDIFIHPGKPFNVISGLITNFHLPESTLIMLVAAFAGYDNTFKAYQEAISLRYRFYSYGDAMLIM